jgi:4-alpha-glucanotransferase
MTSSVSKDLTDYEVGEDLPEDYADWQPRKDPKDRRRAGILLHPTSLPGSNGIGELGQEAFCFLDWHESDKSTYRCTRSSSWHHSI